MGNVQKIAGRKRNGLEILRQLADLSNFGRRPQQEIFILSVELGQGANNVPRISADAEVVDPANIDGNLHPKDLSIDSGNPARITGQ